jgi:hypothetical protein
MYLLSLLENFFLVYVSANKKIGSKILDEAEQAEHEHHLKRKAAWYGGITCGLILLSFILLLFGILAIFLGWHVAWFFTGGAILILGAGIFILKELNFLPEGADILGNSLLISGLITVVIAGIVMLVPKGLGTSIVFLVAGLLSLLVSYIMLNWGKVGLGGALITMTLAKNVLVDSQIALAENIYAAMANTAIWAETNLKLIIRLVAAAFPGVNLAEVEGAMSQKPEYKSGKDILEKAELTIVELKNQAIELFDSIKKFYLVTAGLIFMVFLEVMLLKLGHNPVVDLFNQWWMICSILLLTLIFTWKATEKGTLYPLIKWLATPLLLAAVVLTFVDAYVYPLKAALSHNKEKTELKQGYYDYEKDVLVDSEGLVKAIEDTTGYVTRLDKNGIGHIDTGTRILKEQLVSLYPIRAGEKWKLINKQVYAFAGSDSQRFIHISRGLNQERIEALVSPEFFEAVTAKDRKKQSTGRSMPKKDNGFPLPLSHLSTKQVAPNVWEVILPANVGNGRTDIKVPPNSKLTLFVSGNTNPAGLSSKLDAANQDTDARGINVNWRGRRTSVISWPYSNNRAPNELGIVAYRLGEDSRFNGIFPGGSITPYNNTEEMLDIAYNDDFTDDDGNFRPDFFNDNTGYITLQVKLN